MPIDSPAEKMAKINQRSTCGLSGNMYHLIIAQRVIVVKKVDMA